MPTYTQYELLQLIEKYNTTPKEVVKGNLKLIKLKYNFENANIMSDLRFGKEKVNQWFNKSSKNVPTFEDALKLSEQYNFSITELVQ